MATKFKVWVDSPNTGGRTNIQDASTFASDSQREYGFALGASASSIRVNSGIRQANLVACALMEAILPNTQLDLTSSVNDLKTEIVNYFATKISVPTTTDTALDTLIGYKSDALKKVEVVSTITNVAKVPTSAAVWTKIGGLSYVTLSESAYEALTVKDSNTIYFVTEDI